MSDTITISLDEYEELIDTRDHLVAMAGILAGDETIPEEDMDAFLAAPTPLAFWRERRGLTQTAFAVTLGISQPYLSQIESGARTGDVGLYSRMARALRVRVEDLLDD